MKPRSILLSVLLLGPWLAACGEGQISTDGGTTSALAGAPVEIEFRPVLVMVPTIGLPLDAETMPPDLDVDATLVPSPDGETTETTASVLGVDLVLHDDEGFEYQLGPRLAAGELLESAEAVGRYDGDWAVALVLKPGPEGIDLFNEAAGVCYRRPPACPTGQLAIIIDGELAGAPSIHHDRFERDQIEISGYSELEARTLAARINGLPLPDPHFTTPVIEPEPSNEALPSYDGPPPGLGDHWHAAFGIYLCDRFLPPLIDVRPDTTGIHTHADGLIHVHPFEARYAGEGANFDTFGSTVGMSFGDGSFEIDGVAYDSNNRCDGAPGRVVLYEWPSDEPSAEPVVHRDGLGEVWFHEDRLAFTLALVPDGGEVPRPPSIPAFDEL
jgi:hypothetical protein